MILKLPEWYRPDRRVARYFGLGCWCCGDYRKILTYRFDPPERARIFNYLTWCRACKFAACVQCGDYYTQNQPQLVKLVAKYQAKTRKAKMDTPPETVCTACQAALRWDNSMRIYVEKSSGMPMCYPKGQVLGNMSHKPGPVE